MDGIERAISILVTEVSVPDEAAELVWDAVAYLERALDILRQQTALDKSPTEQVADQ